MRIRMGRRGLRRSRVLQAGGCYVGPDHVDFWACLRPVPDRDKTGSPGDGAGPTIRSEPWAVAEGACVIPAQTGSEATPAGRGGEGGKEGGNADPAPSAGVFRQLPSGITTSYARMKVLPQPGGKV